MAETTPDRDLDITIDVLGQVPLPIYTQICFCFPIDDSSSPSDISDNLELGLDRLFVVFPWLAGCVVNEGAGPGNTGVYKIKTSGTANHLVLRDMRETSSFPSMEDLHQAGFPAHMLDEDVIAPRKTRIASDQRSPPEVLLLQATIIRGGLLLTFLGHHQAMDGIGQDEIIGLFSRACRGEDFTDEERAIGNLSESNVIPLLGDSYVMGSELDHQLLKPDIQRSLPDARKSAQCTWAYFSISQSALETIKSIASRVVLSGFVSTDDALSAFIWKSVARVRLARLPASTSSTFARAVDVRRLLDISPTHPGFAQNMIYSTFTLQELSEQPLGVIASELRSKVDPATSPIAHDTRALGTAIARTPDKSIFRFGAKLDRTSGIFFSSWAKMNCYKHDFGSGLGTPQAVGRTKSHPSESLMYLMPKAPNGEIRLVACLSEEDLGRLRVDGEFQAYAKCVS